MKKTTLLKSMLLLCALIVGSGSVWGQVASVAPEDGKSYVVAAYVNSKYYALPNGAVGGSTIAGTEISLNALNKVNTSVAEGKTWTLEEGTGANEGQYYIKYTSGTDTYWLYKNATSDKNYNFAVNKSSKNYWTFTKNGTGYTVTAVDRGDYNLNIQCNSGTFRCYSTATPIILLEIGNVAGQVETPSFSPTGGKYNTAQSVTINCGTDGATIHYTTNGTDPTTSSPTYSSALSVTSTTTIKAIAVKDGLTNSDIATATYYIVYPEASLPFAFNGGKADIANTSGLSHSGLGTDYSANTNPNTQLKFDDANDELVLRINENPGKLTFSIKGNGNGPDPWSGGTFTVQESADGSSYTDVESYNDLGDETSKTITTLKSTTRYIKWIYTTKSFGNVGLGNIRLSPQTEAISTASGKNYATYVTTNDLDFSSVSGAIKAYVAASEAAGANITFTGKDAVPAGTPLLIKTTTPGATVNVPVAASTPNSIETNYLVAGNGSNVTYNAGAGQYYYILTNGQFKAANNSPVAVGKAYLSLPSAASANELTVNFEDGDGDVTGIKNLTTTLSQGEGVAYNLAGQRVNASHKGLVIVNGKKYLNK